MLTPLLDLLPANPKSWLPGVLVVALAATAVAAFGVYRYYPDVYRDTPLERWLPAAEEAGEQAGAAAEPVKPMDDVAAEPPDDESSLPPVDAETVAQLEPAAPAALAPVVVTDEEGNEDQESPYNQLRGCRFLIQGDSAYAEAMMPELPAFLAGAALESYEVRWRYELDDIPVLRDQSRQDAATCRNGCLMVKVGPRASHVILEVDGVYANGQRETDLTHCLPY